MYLKTLLDFRKKISTYDRAMNSLWDRWVKKNIEEKEMLSDEI